MLICDDDHVTRTLIRRLLDRDHGGYAITEVSDGLAAWNALEKGLNPDLCILDIMMPGLNGMELLAKLRADQRFKHLRVMFCSAVNDRQNVVKAAALGISGYLLKPLVADKLLEQVQRACGDRSFGQGPEPLEPRTLALARLRIDAEAYIELLRLLAERVREVLALLSSAPMPTSVCDTRIQLVGIRGAALNLGAVPLGTAVSGLEHAVRDWDEHQAFAWIERLRIENERLVSTIGIPVAEPSDVVKNQGSP